MDILRDYQREVLDRLEEAWTRVRSVMVQMPTGTGKTVLLAETIRKEMRNERSSSARLLPEGRKKGERRNVLVVAHRRELIEQIKETLTQFIDDSVQFITVESIQKLTRSNHNYPLSSINYQLIIIDEAHHAVAKTYRELWERWPEARFLGLTATPCRMNDTGFQDLFQVLIQSYTIREFIKAGWLSDFEYVTAEPDNPILRQVAGLTKRGADGDYQTKEMALVMDCEESIAHLYRSYRKFVDGKKGIVYAINQEHAQHITAYYREQGVRCAMIDSHTEQDIRKETVEQYRQGAIDVLVNVDIFGEGFDVPEVEFIQLARPTLSLCKYLQQVGRGMRISAGKECVTILDHVGMYQAFGLPTEDWDWQLMFTGKMAGKAGMGRQGLLYVRSDETEKELVNLKMIRIKRKDEEHRGLEVFIQDGLYGITKDGQMIHKPLFEHVTLTQDGFFARCTYPYPVYKSRTTLIDKEGRDLGLRMYGNLEWEGDVLKGRDINSRPLYWDRKYGNYYSEMPVFVVLAGVEMVKLRGGYTLRKYPTLMKPMRKIDIYYNNKVVWMSDWLLMKKREGDNVGYSPLKILSYGFNGYYVKTERAGQPYVTKIDTGGNVAGQFWKVPEEDDNRAPYWRQTPLVNASTGRVGFPPER